MSGKKGNSGAMEPLYEYVVVINIYSIKTGREKASRLRVMTLARSKYEAREKVFTKMMHLYPILSNYEFGVKNLLYKLDPVICN